MNNELRKVAKKLRLATMLVKLIPFVSAAVYALCLLVYMFGNDTILLVVDSLFYISPLMVLLMYVLGVVFECCVWHRIQCVILLLPTIISLADGLWLDLSSIATIINMSMTGLLVCASSYNAYRMFCCDGTRDE